MEQVTPIIEVDISPMIEPSMDEKYAALRREKLIRLGIYIISEVAAINSTSTHDIIARRGIEAFLKTILDPKHNTVPKNISHSTYLTNEWQEFSNAFIERIVNDQS